MKDFSTTLFPCSQLGNIVKPGKKFSHARQKKLTELQEKTILTLDEEGRLKKLLSEKDECDTLSKSAKSFLIKRYVIEKYYREYDSQPLQLLKGTMAEKDALSFFCSVVGVKYKKNKKLFSDDFLQGKPDVVEKEIVFEIKSSWDIFTFLKNVSADQNSAYYWQLQGYLSLTGKDAAELVYCLVSTPDEIIEEEFNRILARRPSIFPLSKEAAKIREMLYFNMRFDDIPKEERILRFSVERNDHDIARIRKKVGQARDYLTEFQQQHLYFTKQHRKSILNSLNTEADDGNSED